MKPCSICGSEHEEWQGHVFVANGTDRVGKSVANMNPGSWRVQRWREANRGVYNARQRELMRRRREQKKAEGSPGVREVKDGE